jgi:hypothetical protein
MRTAEACRTVVGVNKQNLRTSTQKLPRRSTAVGERFYASLPLRHGPSAIARIGIMAERTSSRTKPKRRQLSKASRPSMTNRSTGGAITVSRPHRAASLTASEILSTFAVNANTLRRVDRALKTLRSSRSSRALGQAKKKAG